MSAPVDVYVIDSDLSLPEAASRAALGEALGARSVIATPDLLRAVEARAVKRLGCLVGAERGLTPLSSKLTEMERCSWGTVKTAPFFALTLNARALWCGDIDALTAEVRELSRWGAQLDRRLGIEGRDLLARIRGDLSPSQIFISARAALQAAHPSSHRVRVELSPAPSDPTPPSLAQLEALAAAAEREGAPDSHTLSAWARSSDEVGLVRAAGLGVALYGDPRAALGRRAP